MPRGRLNERYVQASAITWLTAQWRAQADVLTVVGVAEARVRAATKLGRGRADGLVAALQDGKIHVASIEAKSRRTLFSTKHRYKNAPWFTHSLAAGLLALLCAFAVGWTIGHWVLLWVLPFLLFVIVTVTYALLTVEQPRYQVIDVVNQVKRYPANEQWIALSADAYNRLGAKSQEKLQLSCRHNGIGLLRVSPAQRVLCLETATHKPVPGGITDFLTCYDREHAIRRELQAAQQPSAADAVGVLI